MEKIISGLDTFLEQGSQEGYIEREDSHMHVVKPAFVNCVTLVYGDTGIKMLHGQQFLISQR